MAWSRCRVGSIPVDDGNKGAHNLQQVQAGTPAGPGWRRQGGHHGPKANDAQDQEHNSSNHHLVAQSKCNFRTRGHHVACGVKVSRFAGCSSNDWSRVSANQQRTRHGWLEASRVSHCFTCCLSASWEAAPCSWCAAWRGVPPGQPRQQTRPHRRQLQPQASHEAR